MNAITQRVDFSGSLGASLSARLDLPAGKIRGYALFAHCFTCSKDFNASRRIAAELAMQGIAVMRFDFTGLGSSDGDFAHTNFSSNVRDLVLAADHLRQNYQAPTLLVGHSLGGAAVLAAAGEIPEVKAVATIGAPSDAEHVVHNFHADFDRIVEDGEAEVTLGGRKFTIGKQFIDDLKTVSVAERASTMRKALLVLHSPLDNTVGIENAAAIFTAAKHPKSFVSLDKADHLITREEDAKYAAHVISIWAERFLEPDEPRITPGADEPEVLVAETGQGKFQNTVSTGIHRLLADEPKSFGGLDSGPSPYDFVSIGLGACTSMTLRMYVDRKKLDVGKIEVAVNHGKVHASDCEHCDDETKAKGGKIDQFERIITVEKPIDDELRAKLLEIADKCPVHKTLEASSVVKTRYHDG